MATRLFVLWMPVAIYMAGIFYFSSLPGTQLTIELPDKPIHMFLYSFMALLVVRALSGGLPARISSAVAGGALVVTVVYGVTDEFHQSFVPGRSADLQDLYADIAGAALGVSVCWVWGIISCGSRHSPGASST